MAAESLSGMAATALGEPLVPSARFEELVGATESRLAYLKKRAGKRSNAEKRLVATRALSLLYLEREDLERCDKQLRKSLSLASKLKGERSLEFKAQLNYLAVLYWKRSKVDEAERTLHDLVASLERHLERRDGRKGFEQVNELLIRAKFNLAGVLATQGKHEAAADTENDARARARAAGLAADEDLAEAFANHEQLSARSGGAAILRGSSRSGGTKRSSFRQRISLMLGGGATGVGGGGGSSVGGGVAASAAEAFGDSLRSSGLSFAFNMPVGKRSVLFDQIKQRSMADESAAMRIPLVSLLDHTAALLSDARRFDHVELLFRTALSGSYGSLSKLEEQRITVRLALLLADIPEYLDEATSTLQRALYVTEELYGKDDIQVAVVAGDLGTFFAKKGDLESAERLFTRALGIFRSLDLPHPKEEIVFGNLGLLRKSQDPRSKAGIVSRMKLAIDDEWIFQNSEGSVSEEAIARTLRIAIDLEAREKGTPLWYNWHENDRKKSLLAYALEVFRDTSHDWEEILAPRYLRIALEVMRLCGRSSAFVPLTGVPHFKLGGGNGAAPVSGQGAGRGTTAESIIRAQLQASRYQAQRGAEAVSSHPWVSAASALFSPWQQQQQQQQQQQSANGQDGDDVQGGHHDDDDEEEVVADDDEGEDDDDDDEEEEEEEEEAERAARDRAGSASAFSHAPPGSAARNLYLSGEAGKAAGKAASKEDKLRQKLRDKKKKKKKKGSIVAALLRRRRDSSTQGMGLTQALPRPSKAHQSTGFLRPDLDIEEVLLAFFAEVDPGKSRPAVQAIIEQHDGREDMVFAHVEAKYSVRFNRDGTWEARERQADDDRGSFASTRPVNPRSKSKSSRHRGPAETVADDDSDDAAGDDLFGMGLTSLRDDIDDGDDHHDDGVSAEQAQERMDARSEATTMPSSAASLVRRRRDKSAAKRESDDVDRSGTLNPDVALRATLVQFYREHVPDRGEKDVDDMLAHFGNRHKALFKALRKKYGVRFLPTGAPTFD